MTAPIVPPNVSLPIVGMQPDTYGDMLEMLNCSCVVGGLITPSSLPSATIHLGDIVSEISKFLQYFTSVYKVIAVILKIIACIIDIICALPDPFQTIAAVIRFFTVCFPELLSLFPQFAILLLILCLIKIILSIIVYIITVLIPMIMDIIENLKVFKEALTNFNADSASACAFKILSLFEELRSLLAILALLMPIIEMIKALLGMGIGIPCLGGGGSCDDCNTPDPRCPPVMQNTSIDGVDGSMLVLYGDTPDKFDMVYSSVTHRNDFITLAGFFPKDVNYEEVKKEEELAYTLTVNGTTTYAVTRIDEVGNLYLKNIVPELVSDGYLSDSYGSNIKISDPFVRFGSATAEFSIQNGIPKYITINDTRSDDYENSGTWQVVEIYDGYNVKLTKGDPEGKWKDVSSSLSPTPYIYWRVTPLAPSLGYNQQFSLKINHAELIRHNMISLGCIPQIKETTAALANRYPEIIDGTGPNLGLPPEAQIPDVAKLINDLSAAVDAVIPHPTTVQYIYDNYDQMADAMPNLAPTIIGYLESFRQDTITYAGYVMPRVVDVEASTLDATPKLQIVGNHIDVDLVVYDRSGYTMGKGLPQGMVDATIHTDKGELTETEEVIENNVVTGKFKAVLRSQTPIKANLTAKVFDKDVSYFDGATLVPKVVEVEFVDTVEMMRRRGIIDVPEPLGSGNVE